MSYVSQTSINFIHELIRNFPEFKSIYQEHIQDNDEILPHILLADIARWIIHEFKTDGASAEVRRLLNYLETSYNHHDSDIEELIHVSLLEYIYDLDFHGESITNYLGDSLKSQVSLINGES